MLTFPKSPFILSIGLIAVAIGCATASRSETPSAPLAETPEVSHGREVFMQHCNECHPGGNAGVGPSINGKSLPGFLIKTQVRWGLGKMPSFSKDVIPGNDLSDVVKFLKAQRKSEKAKS